MSTEVSGLDPRNRENAEPSEARNPVPLAVIVVVSISLGDTCLFRIGGMSRKDTTRSFRLSSGDVVVLGGDARMAFHGVDRIYPGTSTLLRDWFPDGGRINLTLRRVTRP